MKYASKSNQMGENLIISYSDFLSVIYFKEGKSEDASKMINEAMIKSKEYVDRFQPILAKYKK